MKSETLNEKYYYEALGITQRCCDELLFKFGTLSKASRKFGYLKPVFYQYSFGLASFSSSKIFEIAKKLNLSVEYLITGKNRAEYIPFEYGLENILKEHKKLEWGDSPDFGSYQVILHLIKKKPKKSIRISTLLELSRVYKKSVTYLIGGL